MEGDPAYAEIELPLADQPAICVPTITFDGADNGVKPAKPAQASAHRFSGPRVHRILAGAGHNLLRQMTHTLAQAVLELVRF